MNKLLEVLIVKKILIIALGIFLLQVAQVSAQEIYAYSETRGGRTTDTYVVKESAQGTNYGLKVQLNTTGSGVNKYWEVGFRKSGDDDYIIWLPSSYEDLIARGNNIIKPNWVKILYIAVS